MFFLNFIVIIAQELYNVNCMHLLDFLELLQVLYLKTDIFKFKNIILGLFLIKFFGANYYQNHKNVFFKLGLDILIKLKIFSFCSVEITN